MIYRLPALLLTAALILAGNSHANEHINPDYTLLHLSASAQEEVAPDRLQATLRLEKEAPTAFAVQQYINRTMQVAVQKAKSNSGVKVVTGRYNVHERWTGNHSDKNRKKTWKGNQTLTIKGANFADILDLAGQLQKDGFLMNGTHFYLSKEKTRAIKKDLVHVALDDLQAQARAFSDKLGLTFIRFGNIHLEYANPPVQHYRQEKMMMARGMSADMAMAPPVAEGDDMTLSTTVRADVILK